LTGKEITKQENTNTSRWLKRQHIGIWQLIIVEKLWEKNENWWRCKHWE